MTDTNPITERVEQYNADLAAIREDDSLSEKGKHDRITELYETSKAEVDKLRATQQTASEDRVSQLHRSLWGVGALGNLDPASATAFRQVTEQAHQHKTPQALGNWMEQANQVGDRTAIKAGARYAYERSKDALAAEGWEAIVEEFIRQNPQLADDLTELDHLTSGKGKTQAALDALTQAVLKPRELGKRRQLDDTKPERKRPEYLTRG